RLLIRPGAMARRGQAMRSRVMAILLAFASLGSPAWADPTADELSQAAEAERVGSDMFAYDQAAWHATDRFAEDLDRSGQNLEALLEQGYEGYIVEPGEGGSLLAT